MSHDSMTMIMLPRYTAHAAGAWVQMNWCENIHAKQVAEADFELGTTSRQTAEAKTNLVRYLNRLNGKKEDME